MSYREQLPLILSESISLEPPSCFDKWSVFWDHSCIVSIWWVFWLYLVCVLTATCLSVSVPSFNISHSKFGISTSYAMGGNFLQAFEFSWDHLLGCAFCIMGKELLLIEFLFWKLISRSMFILVLLLGNFVKISQIYQKNWKVKALVSQSCLTTYNPIDCSPPGSSVHGILQARILQWFAMPFSRGSSWSRNCIWVSCIAGRFFTTWATSKAPYTPKDSPPFPLSKTSAFILVLWLVLCHWPLDKRRVWGDWRETSGLIGRSICIIFKEAGICCFHKEEA